MSGRTPTSEPVIGRVPLKLAIVQHWRCGEPADATTFVWVPSAWTEDDLGAAVNRAKDAYIAALRDAAELLTKEAPPNPGWQWTDFAKLPEWQDKTIAEVQEAYKWALSAFNDWAKEHTRLTEPFANYLRAQGCEPWYMYSDLDTGGMLVECDWGHHHGTRYDLGDGPPPDWPGPMKAGYEIHRKKRP